MRPRRAPVGLPRLAYHRATAAVDRGWLPANPGAEPPPRGASSRSNWVRSAPRCGMSVRVEQGIRKIPDCARVGWWANSSELSHQMRPVYLDKVSWSEVSFAEFLSRDVERAEGHGGHNIRQIFSRCPDLPLRHLQCRPLAPGSATRRFIRLNPADYGGSIASTSLFLNA